jgi:addiction module RelB/DinJ family antitoxin
MSVQVSARIDKATKQQFDKVCENIGISPSHALSMFIRGVINHNGIPFNALVSQEKVPKMSREEMFGCMRGQFEMADDFDAPLEDFREYME